MSARTPKVGLRPKARGDLGQIWEYTREAWGLEQADTYLRALDNTFNAIAKQPMLGRSRDEVLEGLKAYPSGKHVVFYFVTEHGVDVVRVLHERMDVSSRLHE